MTTTSATGSRRAAFTLIELSIATFILAVVMAFSAPAFVRSYNAAVLNEAARTFATTCQYARIQAVSHQQPATLHVDLDRQAFWMTQSLKGEDGDRTDQTLKSHALPPRVVLASAERSDQPARGEKSIEATFYPNGTCDPVTVVFRGTERTGVAAWLDPVTCKVTMTSVK